MIAEELFRHGIINKPPTEQSETALQDATNTLLAHPAPFKHPLEHAQIIYAELQLSWGVMTIRLLVLDVVWWKDGGVRGIYTRFEGGQCEAAGSAAPILP
jgi:hypothetical protein